MELKIRKNEQKMDEKSTRTVTKNCRQSTKTYKKIVREKKLIKICGKNGGKLRKVQ